MSFQDNKTPFEYIEDPQFLKIVIEIGKEYVIMVG